MSARKGYLVYQLETNLSESILVKEVFEETSIFLVLVFLIGLIKEEKIIIELKIEN